MEKFSIYLSYLLRHHPETLELEMDHEGYVDVKDLLQKVNAAGRYTITRDMLDKIVRTDRKGRYRYSEDGSKIKACQGHSVPFVQPKLAICQPPTYLYHGSTGSALEKIKTCGYISKMKRHAVHMQDNERPAWLSAMRWHDQAPVVLKIDACKMYQDGFTFGKTENDVWCTEKVPFSYVTEVLTPDSWAKH